MKIAVHGLGRMGSQIAQKLAETDDIDIIAHNRSPEPIKTAEGQGAVAAYTKQDVLTAFGDEQPIIWLMLPAEIIDAQLDEWLSLLPAGSIVVDGGNSDFRLTRERSKRVESKQMAYVDVGVSGGVWGYQNGFSMMAGANDKAAFDKIDEVLKVLALPEGAYAYFGPSGSGHFVKMTHNAIEYGMMESLAEGYRLLKEGPYDKLNLNDAAMVWQHHSVITSWLNELVLSITEENPELDGIEGKVAESGEARWALEAAKDQNIPMPAIQTAFDVRIKSLDGEISYATKMLAAMRNKFGGHKINV